MCVSLGQTCLSRVMKQIIGNLFSSFGTPFCTHTIVVRPAASDESSVCLYNLHTRTYRSSRRRGPCALLVHHRNQHYADRTRELCGHSIFNSSAKGFSSGRLLRNWLRSDRQTDTKQQQRKKARRVVMIKSVPFHCALGFFTLRRSIATT